MGNKKILIVTDGYPLVEGSEPYLKRELEVLTSSVYEIELVIDLSGKKGEVSSEPNTYRYNRTVLCLVKSICSLLLWKEMIREYKRTKKLNFRKFKIALDYLAKAHHFSDFIKSKKANLFYTYWMTPKSLGVILSGQNLVSRIHGFDVYYERHPEAYLPFREEILKGAERIGTISDQGRLYLSNLFPSYKNILTTNRLGVKVPVNYLEQKERDYMHIVSCSSLIPLKQVGYIIDALKSIDQRIKWTHFGDGPMKEELMKAAIELPENIVVEWKGFFENEKVLEFYQREVPDLFINASTTEGIPVSLMEAYAHSIPAIAPDVGGIKEVFQEKEFLLPNNFSVQDLSVLIKRFLILSKQERASFRRTVFEYAKSNLDYEKLYKVWLNELSKQMDKHD